ncbi:MAG TPA: glycosyltransferase family 39 protein [Anaerolineae bacterium]|nr:glycosyltransferase family 39 protein [Anaerolineae bacterium]
MNRDPLQARENTPTGAVLFRVLRDDRITGLLIGVALFAFGLWLWLISPPADIRPPLTNELAFHWLMPLRGALLSQATNSGPFVLGLGAVSLILIWALALRGRRVHQAVSASILVGCSLLAFQAQVFVLHQQHESGLALYLFAGTLFFAWVWIKRKTSPAAPRAGLSYRIEILLLALVLAISVFGRVYDLKRIPYGVDGDESKWTEEVVTLMVDGHDWGATEYHRRYLPMSFWMEAPFQRLMGAGLTPGRVEVAVFSVVAAYVFYRLARELFDAPTALIATFLLAVSLPDLSASRVGNVESHVKLWSILPFYGLAVALRTRRLRHFLLTGGAIAGAMLTYETLMPLLAAVFTLAIGAALRERREWRTWLRYLAALVTAPVVVSAGALDYLFGRMQYYTSFGDQTGSPFVDQLQVGLEGLLKVFFGQAPADWLYLRSGPYINGLLTPLLVLGLLYALVHIRRKGHAFALVWWAWVFIPIPLLLQTPWPRILYPGVPALYLLIAVVLIAIYRTLAQATRLPRTLTGIGLAALGGFGLLNLTIWFQEMPDPFFEVRRREVAEIVATQVEGDGPLLMPYIMPGEAVETEQPMIALLLRERRGARYAGEFRPVRYSELLPTLAQRRGTARQTKVLVDISETILQDQRQNILAAFHRCYPSEQVTTNYFQLYTVAENDLNRPACWSGYLIITPPLAVIEGGAATPIAIGWSLNPTPASRSTLECWRARDDVLWIEGESFEDRAGWIADNQFVTGFSGSGYLADDPGNQYAATTIDIPRPGAYRLWVRAYRRQNDPFPGIIEIAGQAFAFAEAQPGTLNAWQWQALGELTLDAGPAPIRALRPFDLSRIRLYIALFVDTFVLSADPDFDPARDDRWQPALRQSGSEGRQTQGRFEIRLAPGQYRCEIVVSDGARLVDETGGVGIRSDPVYFRVNE